MGTYDRYKTSTRKEQEGIAIETAGGVFFARRKGVTNKPYVKKLEEKFRKWRRVGVDKMPFETRQRIMLEAFVEDVLTGWAEGADDPRLAAWPEDERAALVVTGQDGAPLKFTRENAIQLFGLHERTKSSRPLATANA